MHAQNNKKYTHIQAKKSLGQNFLCDENILQSIVDVCEISDKNILEVGPGYGALSAYILEKKPKNLHLVELDGDLITLLEERCIQEGGGEEATSCVKIIHSDILAYTPEFQDYSVVANIPYYITSPILTHFLYTLPHTPQTLCILMQDDVAQKILGGKKQKSSVLSLMIAKKAYSSKKIHVPKESFSPKPKVESAVVFFQTHTIYEYIDDVGFLSFIKTGFQEPRKKLIKNLIKGSYSQQKISEFLCQQGVSKDFRGEDGDIDFWIKLYTFLK